MKRALIIFLLLSLISFSPPLVPAAHAGFCDSIFKFICDVARPLSTESSSGIKSVPSNSIDHVPGMSDPFDNNRTFVKEGNTKKEVPVNKYIEKDLEILLHGTFSKTIEIPKCAEMAGKDAKTDDSYPCKNIQNTNPNLGLVAGSVLVDFGISTESDEDINNGIGRPTADRYMGRTAIDPKIMELRRKPETPDYDKQGDLKTSPEYAALPLYAQVGGKTTRIEEDQKRVMLDIARGYACALFEKGIRSDFEKFCGPDMILDMHAGYLIAPNPGVSCADLPANTRGKIVGLLPKENTCVRPLYDFEILATSGDIQNAEIGLDRGTINQIAELIMGPGFASGQISPDSIFGGKFGDRAKLLIPEPNSEEWKIVRRDFAPAYKVMEMPATLHQKPIQENTNGQCDVGAQEQPAAAKNIDIFDRTSDLAIPWTETSTEATSNLANFMSPLDANARRETTPFKKEFTISLSFDDPKVRDKLGSSNIPVEEYQMCTTIPPAEWSNWVATVWQPWFDTFTVGPNGEIIRTAPEPTFTKTVTRKIEMRFKVNEKLYAQIARNISLRDGLCNLIAPYEIVKLMDEEIEGVKANEAPQLINNQTCQGDANCDLNMGLPILGGPLIGLSTSATSDVGLGICPSLTVPKSYIDANYPNKNAVGWIKNFAQQNTIRELAKKPWEVLASFGKDKTVSDTAAR